MSETHSPNIDVEIIRGNGPDVIQSAIEMQSRYYTITPGFNADYKTQLTSGLAKLEPHINNTDSKSEVWTARSQDHIIGTIFVDSSSNTDRNNHARLTSFVVDSLFQGKGIGRRLLNEAMRFVDENGFEETRLWTFEGSDAARSLYESVGFALEKEVVGEYFGILLKVQLFIRQFQGKIRP